MSREVYFGNYGDMTFGCISNNLAAVILCVLEGTIVLPIVIAAIAANDSFATLCCNG